MGHRTRTTIVARRMTCGCLLMLTLIGCQGGKEQSKGESVRSMTEANQRDAESSKPEVPKTSVSLALAVGSGAGDGWAGYVDDARCGACHDEIATSFHGHSMGRSMVDLTSPENTWIEQHPEGKIAEFDEQGFHYEVHRVGKKLVHRQSRSTNDGGEISVIEKPVSYLIGSGNHGQSFIVQQQNTLFMSPITWYPDKQVWRLSPGYEKNNSEFNRPVVEICLNCHTNRPQPRTHTQNGYADPPIVGGSIGCQRCHGPGEAHITWHEQGTDVATNSDPIVNPAKLPAAAREAVCQHCHLSGVARINKPGKSLADFRPGEPQEQTYAIFVTPREHQSGAKFVGHVEQMYDSVCFRASDGKMGCTTCHDPHRKPAEGERDTYFRDRCLDCHSVNACELAEDQRRQADSADRCVICHMPTQKTEVQHAASTNHRILRRPEVAEVKASGTAKKIGLPLIPFPPRATTDAYELSREFAIAVVQGAGTHPEVIDTSAVEFVVPVLEQIVAASPNDIEALEALGEAALTKRDLDVAMRSFGAVLQLAPRREHTLASVADVYMRIGEPGRALPYWEQLRAVNPHMSRYWYGLAKAQAGIGNWQGCQQTTSAAIDRFPTSVGARHLLIESQLRLGNRSAAAEAYRWFELFRPTGYEQVKAWYQQHGATPAGRE